MKRLYNWFLRCYRSHAYLEQHMEHLFPRNESELYARSLSKPGFGCGL